MSIPRELKFTKEHEWVRLEGDVITVGITEYAQGELGDIVYVELPGPGTAVQQNESFGTIEAVKAVSDLYSPVSGEVVEVNGILQDQPEHINSDPYGAGWMIRIKLADSSELEELLDADGYASLIG